MRTRLALLTLAGSLAVATPAAAAPGDLDTSFGTGGVLESTQGARDDSGRVALGPGGSVLLVGTDVLSDVTKLQRADAEGQPAGATTVLDSTGHTVGVEGRPVVWGDRVAVADGDGVTFVGLDGTGAGHVGVTGTDVYAAAVVVDGTGLLIAGTRFGVGPFVARVKADGTRDTAFGTVEIADPRMEVTDAVRTPQGDLLLVGEDDGGTPFTGGTTGQDDGLQVVKLTGAKTPDAGFGTGGTLRTTAGVAGWNVGQAVRDGDGRLLVTGNADEVVPGHVHVVRITAAGALDTTYATDGLARVSFPPVGQGEETFVSPGSIALDAAGRAVVGSTLRRFGTGLTSHVALARFTAGGTADAAFGTGGRATPSAFGGIDQAWYGLAIQPSGKLVLAGQVSRASGGRRSMVAARFLAGDLEGGAPPAVRITSPAADQAFGATAPTFGGTLGTAPGDLPQVAVELRRLPADTTVPLPAPVVSGSSWSVALAAPLAAGRYRLTATQPAGDGRDAGTRSVELKVDRTAPTPVITSPADGTQGTDRDVSGTRGTQAANDTSSADVATLVLERRRVTATGPGEWTDGADLHVPGAGFSFGQPLQDEGTYDLRVRQRDDVGNVGRSPVVRYLLDVTAPALALTTPGPAGRIGAVPAFRGTAGVLDATTEHSGDVRTLRLTLRRGTEPEGPAVMAEVAPDGSWSAPWPRTLSGTYTLTATQADAAGATATVERDVVVDTSAPVPTVTDASARGLAGALGADEGDVADVDISLRDATGDEVATPDARVADGRWTADVPGQLPEGRYTAVVSQADEAGNTGEGRLAFELDRDTDPPTPSIRLTANSGDLVAYELERGSAEGDRDFVQLKITRTDVPGVLSDRRFDLPAPRRFAQGNLPVDAPAGRYEMVVTQEDEAGNRGSSPVLSFTKTPGGFAGVETSTPTGQLPAGFAPSRIVPTDAAGRVPDVRGDALDRASDRLQRTFKQVTIRLKGKTIAKERLGKRPGGGTWRVGDVVDQDPEAGANFTTSLGQEDVATLTFWAGEPGGGGADCTELRRAVRGDDLNTALQQLRAAKCTPPDIEVRPSKSVTEPTVRRADADGDVVVLMPVRQRDLDLVVWKGYGLTSGSAPGPSKDDFALSAGSPNVASVLVLGRGMDLEGRQQVMHGAKVRFDLHEVGGLDKTGTTDRTGRLAVGGLAPKRPGTIHVQIEWADAAGERIYGYTTFRVVDRCDDKGFETIIGESWTVRDTKGAGCRIEKAAGAPRAAALDWFSFFAEALRGFGGKVAQAATAGREGVVTAFRNFQVSAQQLVRDAQAQQSRLAEVSRVPSGLWAIGANGVVAAGGGNVVAAGGANVVAAGGANVVAAGGANVVAAGGLNLLGKGGAVVAAGGANVVSAGGANLKLLPDGAYVVAAGGANVVAAGGANVVAAGGANVVAAGGLN